MCILREKAQQLRDGTLQSRGDTLLPLSLATFILEALAPDASKWELMRIGRNLPAHSLPTDEMLAYDASIAALDLKADVSESDHPFFCETIRRQHRHLTLMLHRRLPRLRSMCQSDKIAKITKWAALYPTEPE